MEIVIKKILAESRKYIDEQEFKTLCWILTQHNPLACNLIMKYRNTPEGIPDQLANCLRNCVTRIYDVSSTLVVENRMTYLYTPVLTKWDFKKAI